MNERERTGWETTKKRTDAIGALLLVSVLTFGDSERGNHYTPPKIIENKKPQVSQKVIIEPSEPYRVRFTEDYPLPFYR
ncbi:MAG: hypothetical protein AABX23_02555 [Nanoarchaeota archaeon]|mgnify:CR=1 FL=1